MEVELVAVWSVVGTQVEHFVFHGLLSIVFVYGLLVPCLKDSLWLDFEVNFPLLTTHQIDRGLHFVVAFGDLVVAAFERTVGLLIVPVEILAVPV